MKVVEGLTGNAVLAQDAFTTWPDVGELVLGRIAQQSSNLGHYRSWRALLDRLSADRIFGPHVVAAARRPKEIKIFALQPDLAVYVDGQRRVQWRRQAALEALVYLAHHKVGGQDMASALIEAPRAYEDDTRTGLESADVSKRFHQLLSVLKQVLGRDAIQAATDTWPRRYQLHPDIRVVYDVDQFVAMAESILREPPRPEQLPAIKVARDLRAASYAPVRARMHEWTEGVHNRVERLYQQLLEREIEVAREASLPTTLLEDLLSQSMLDSGVGMGL
jgi:two-component SAPR family response regulator